jgi:CRISPR-associated endonuclease Csn1
MPNKNGPPVPVRKVRVAENLGTAEQLPGTVRNRWVKPGDNYGAAIYENSEGGQQFEVVNFWQATQREKNGEPVFAPQLPGGYHLGQTLRKNDLFLLNLHPDEVEWNNQALLAQHLYRLQKLSKFDNGAPYIEFRLHRAATILVPQEMLRVSSFKGWQSANPIIVRVDHLGSIYQG